MALAAPTILAHGSDELKRLLLAGIVTGEDTWCQLFSEPGSGSDLAGLTTSAYLDGDEWVVNGQKLWSTSAHHADHGMLLARTDWDVPKHAGISWFALPMHQPGVEARPLRQMNGHASFNEVFLTDARVPVDHVVGRPGDGWTVARTTLAHERGLRVDATRPLRGRPRSRPCGRPRPRRRRTSRPIAGTRSGPVGSTWSSSTRRPPAATGIRWPARRSPVCCRCSAPTSGRRSGLPTTGRSAGRPGPRARSASSG